MNKEDYKIAYENVMIANKMLEQENKQLKEKIKHADEFCDRYMGVNLELFDMYELLNIIRVILGGDDNGM